MCKPKGDWRLEETKSYQNGVVYELWHQRVDNCHHIHLPDGMTIVFEHENNEGSIVIKEGVM